VGNFLPVVKTGFCQNPDNLKKKGEDRNTDGNRGNYITAYHCSGTTIHKKKRLQLHQNKLIASLIR
jgi:hypothetical protein